MKYRRRLPALLAPDGAGGGTRDDSLDDLSQDAHSGTTIGRLKIEEISKCFVL